MGYLSEKDVERIARRVVELLREEGKETEMMNSRQCAAWLGISTSALRTRVCEGTIPFHKKGGRLYFDRAEVEREYLAERREFDLRRERAARYAVIDRVGRPRPRE